jgi:hypothetical protein
MKAVMIIPRIATLVSRTVFVAGLTIILHIPGNLYAQDTSKTEVATTAEPAEEESGLISPALEFSTVQKSDNTIALKAAVKAKVKGTFYKLPLLKLTFLQVTESGDKALGFVITDGNGKAQFIVKSADTIKTDKEGKLTFKVSYAGNKQVETAEEELTIKRARLEITPLKEDSLLSVSVKLIDIGTGTEIPVKETVVGVFVNRSFNALKLGEITTDENGEGSVEVANNLPGDAKGNITLLAKLDENEVYGNLEAASVQKWGTVVSDKDEDQPRALWSSHPPIWMLVTFILLMAVVWGHYIVIVFQLIRLRKEEPHTALN